MQPNPIFADALLAAVPPGIRLLPAQTFTATGAGAVRDALDLAVSRAWRALATGALLTLAATAQTQPAPVILEIDWENGVRYWEDVSDATKFGTLAGPVPVASGVKNLTAQFLCGDIIAVNGQPAKGMVFNSSRGLGLTPVTDPGIFVNNNAAIAYRHIVILSPDGGTIGSITGLGLLGGLPPPGAPLAANGADYALSGGTGAFLGARGQINEVTNFPGFVGVRAASITEDPTNRRKNGGGRGRTLVTLYPMSVPQILTVGGDPAVFHDDRTLVTGVHPAKAGETLTLWVSGLGPTRPGSDPGQPFPADPPQSVTSPLQVLLDDIPGEVLAADGVPGAVDQYRVQFRVPAGVGNGPVRVRVMSAWIPGPIAIIPIM